MRKTLLWMLAVTSSCFSLSLHKPTTVNRADSRIFKILTVISPELISPKATNKSLREIADMLLASTLNRPVIDKVLKTIKCASQYNVDHNNVLTIIDYSLPSSEKRLWVFNLYTKKLLFHTYVSHGLKSGTLLSNSFSNRFNSKSSSIGVYKTEDTYYGRHGLSLKLAGLDPGFNDNASGRSVVMHGGWYVNEDFIKKYGRAGRSWGCPALPDHLTTAIINTIKDRSLFVIYYPNDNWFLKSKFLNCDNLSPIRYASTKEKEVKLAENEKREAVLFANRKSLGTEPILVMTADNYARVFHTKAPLERMLRRQINQMEYIALSNTELENLIITNNKDAFNTIYFVIPVVKMVRGYYLTEMHIVNLGKIKEVKLNREPSKSYTVEFESQPSTTLRSTNEFIRWLGL